MHDQVYGTRIWVSNKYYDQMLVRKGRRFDLQNIWYSQPAIDIDAQRMSRQSVTEVR